jgi:hypothetical protein
MADGTQRPVAPRLSFPYPYLAPGPSTADVVAYLRQFEAAHRQWVTRLEYYINERVLTVPVAEAPAASVAGPSVVYDPASQLTGWQIQPDGSIKLFVNGKERQHVT